MFELKNVFVEDKKLPLVLQKLDGLLAQPPTVIPVRNAVVANGKVVAKIPELGGSAKAQFMHHVVSNGYDSVSHKMVAEFLGSIGYQPKGAGNMIDRLKKQHFLTPAKGKKGEYTVNPGGK